MNKELFLALDFKNAPASLQQAATNQYANEKALLKAQQKLIAAQQAVIDAASVVQQGDEILRKELANWTPAVG